MAVTVFDHVARHPYRLLVDLDDGSVVDDVAAVKQAEAEARYARWRHHPQRRLR